METGRVLETWSNTAIPVAWTFMSETLTSRRRIIERMPRRKNLRFNCVSWPYDGHECPCDIRSFRRRTQNLTHLPIVLKSTLSYVFSLPRIDPCLPAEYLEDVRRESITSRRRSDGCTVPPFHFPNRSGSRRSFSRTPSVADPFWHSGD